MAESRLRRRREGVPSREKLGNGGIVPSGAGPPPPRAGSGFRLKQRADAPVRHKRPRERRPSSLMRGAESLSSLAMEVFIEEERFAPRWIGLETGVRSM